MKTYLFLKSVLGADLANKIKSEMPNKEWLEHEVDSDCGLLEVMNDLFIWDNTESGYEYWSKVAHSEYINENIS